jgi:hypothetical protein
LSGLAQVLFAVILGGAAPLMYHMVRPGPDQTAQTQALVTELHEDPGDADSGRSCTFEYEFSVKDQSYAGRSAMSSNEYCSLREGQTIQVRYNPEAPKHNSYVDGRRSFVWSIPLFAMFAVFPGISGVNVLIETFRPYRTN